MNPNRVFLSACLCALLLGSAGCATSAGSRSFAADVRRLQVGVTTQPDAVAVLGPPTRSAPAEQGMTEVTWTKVWDSPGLRHTRSVSILFGANGKMAKVGSKSNAYIFLERKPAPTS